MDLSQELPFGSEPRKADERYRALLAQRDKRGGIPFDHAFAGVLVYIFDKGEFLLQKRDKGTDWNPERVSIFGGRVKNNLNELPTQAAIRELAAETGITARSDQLRVLRAYVETREDVVPVRVFRAIYFLQLDQTPPTHVGEGRAIVQVRFGGIEGFDEITVLSREDINRFWTNIHDLFEEDPPHPEPDPTPASTGAAAAHANVHSADFSSVVWHGTTHLFPGDKQRTAVEMLWKQWEAHPELALREKTIGLKINSDDDNFRLALLFRDHSAWNTMIQKVGPGQYRLAPPPPEAAPSPPPPPRRKNH